MKVIKESEKRAVSFFDLKTGDVFLFCEKPFIKTRGYRIDATDTLLNAVGLKDGEPYGFNSWDRVEFVDAELTIKA